MKAELIILRAAEMARIFIETHGSIMSAVIKEIHLIGGIQVHVYKLKDSESIVQPHSVAILFLLHGRKESVKDVDSIARTIIEKNAAQRRKLWVVTLVKLLFFLNHVISIDL